MVVVVVVLVVGVVDADADGATRCAVGRRLAAISSLFKSSARWPRRRATADGSPAEVERLDPMQGKFNSSCDKGLSGGFVACFKAHLDYRAPLIEENDPEQATGKRRRYALGTV